MSMDELSDEEVVESIVEALDADTRIASNYLKVECHAGKISISGRVSSDEELEALDEILSDELDIEHFDNQVWVDDTLAFEDSEEDDADDELNFDDDEESEEEGDFEDEEE